MIPNPYRSALAALCLVSGAVSAFATAPPVNPEGRPSAPVPINANVIQIAPENGTSDAGVLYEKMRIKRTVPLDPSMGLQGVWDVLYTVQDGTANGERTTYCSWDDQYLYLAAEMPTTRTVRFDIDGKDDGWLTGADNIALQIVPPNENKDPNKPTRIEMERFDTVQNRDQPVWAASPIPVNTVKVKAGRTPQGTYAVCVALPRTEIIGLTRKNGSSFGLRIDSGEALPSLETEVSTIAVRPMVRLSLADSVDAIGGGLMVKVSLSSPEVTPQASLKATLEVKNMSQGTVRVGQMYLRGAGGSATLVDSGTFTGADILPGKSLKRELRTTISPVAPFGNVVLTGGVETTDAGTLSALVSFAKVEPYEVRFEVDQTPVPPGTIVGKDDSRDARVNIRSRASGRETAKVTLTLPAGWTIDKDDLVRNIKLSYAGDVRGTMYRIIVPPKANPGKYPINLRVEAGGRTYTNTSAITVQ